MDQSLDFRVKKDTRFLKLGPGQPLGSLSPEDRFRRQLRAMQLSDEAINRRPRPSMPRMPWEGSDAVLTD